MTLVVSAWTALPPTNVAAETEHADTNGVRQTPWQSDASACAGWFRLSQFTPAVCNHNYAPDVCSDRCENASINLNPECFVQLNLPCGVRSELFGAADAEGGLHISRLLESPDFSQGIYVFRQSLFEELRGRFVSPPRRAALTDATMELSKTNFRLRLVASLERLTAPLSQAAVFRRLAVGAALEPSVEDDFTHLLGLARQSPLLDQGARQALVEELNYLYSEHTTFWQLLQSFDPWMVAYSRANYLNQRLAQLAHALGSLGHSHRSKLLAKASVLNDFIAVNLRDCGFGSVCHDVVSPLSVVEGSSAYAFELFAEQLLEEATAVSTAVQIGPFVSYPEHHTPNYSAFLDTHYEHYSQHPGSDALHSLELALSVASGQSGYLGDGLFEHLAAGASETLPGFVTLGRYQERNVLLCEDYVRLDPRIDQLRSAMYGKADRFAELIKLISEIGHTPSIRQELATLVAETATLRAESEALFGIERLAADRTINVVWTLADGLDPTTDSLDIEYLSINGLYWIPSMAIEPEVLLPGLQDIFTLQGTLLPSGRGKTAGSKQLQLRLTQSPYEACGADQTIRLIIRQQKADGSTVRSVLSANLATL